MKELIKEKFLIVDNAPELPFTIKKHLEVLCHINNVDEKDLDFGYVQATSDKAFSEIGLYKNVAVYTTFTNVKSDAFEELLNAGIKYGIKDKNIFSLMQFSIVGSSFEDYLNEVRKLSKNNVRFYFLKDDCSGFELYNNL